MRELIVDGRFLAQPMTGIQRFATEVLKVFATMEDLHVIVAMPRDAVPPKCKTKRIEYITVGRTKGTLWQQWSLLRFCRKKRLPLLCFGNSAPLLGKANVVLHDILWVEMPHAAPKRSWVRKFKWMVRGFVYHNENLFTVSNFSADRINSCFSKINKAPIVVGCGHEHVRDWNKISVEEIPMRYYLSVGSRYAHKNFQFVMELAERNPEINFVIVGNRIDEYKDALASVKNCIFTGYVDDGRLRFLYEHCEGFILPSLYEGFGLPPLEAVACGCRKLLLSDIPVFHEVYGDCATYFDPYHAGVLVLQYAKTMDEAEASALLEKYTWKGVAEKIIEAIFK